MCRTEFLFTLVWVANLLFILQFYLYRDTYLLSNISIHIRGISQRYLDLPIRDIFTIEIFISIYHVKIFLIAKSNIFRRYFFQFRDIYLLVVSKYLCGYMYFISIMERNYLSEYKIVKFLVKL